MQMYVNVGDQQNRASFDQCVSRKHFSSKSDINNIRMKTDDRVIKFNGTKMMHHTYCVQLHEESINPSFSSNHTLQNHHTIQRNLYSNQVSAGVVQTVCNNYYLYHSWHKPIKERSKKRSVYTSM